jgi:hypothetical protein
LTESALLEMSGNATNRDLEKLVVTIQSAPDVD